MELPLKKVELAADVYMACLQHAFSTEKFEVMGLLIGTFAEDVSKISAVINLRRLDKKKDRVEISPEQLLKAVTEADRLSTVLNCRMQVVGWYHSHPHITVNPSHVDLRTQENYQMLDNRFVGLIFSVFTEITDTKAQEVQLTCFQSEAGESVDIPLEIVRTSGISDRCLRTMIDVPKILIQEEEDAAKTCENHPNILASIHNDAVRTQALIHITDIITKPLIQTFESRIELNKIRVASLRNCLQELEKVANDSLLG